MLGTNILGGPTPEIVKCPTRQLSTVECSLPTDRLIKSCVKQWVIRSFDKSMGHRTLDTSHLTRWRLVRQYLSPPCCRFQRLRFTSIRLPIIFSQCRRPELASPSHALIIPV